MKQEMLVVKHLLALKATLTSFVSPAKTKIQSSIITLEGQQGNRAVAAITPQPCSGLASFLNEKMKVTHHLGEYGREGNMVGTSLWFPAKSKIP